MAIPVKPPRKPRRRRPQNQKTELLPNDKESSKEETNCTSKIAEWLDFLIKLCPESNENMKRRYLRLILTLLLAFLLVSCFDTSDLKTHIIIFSCVAITETFDIVNAIKKTATFLRKLYHWLQYGNAPRKKKPEFKSTKRKRRALELEHAKLSLLDRWMLWVPTTDRIIICLIVKTLKLFASVVVIGVVYAIVWPFHAVALIITQIATLVGGSFKYLWSAASFLQSLPRFLTKLFLKVCRERVVILVGFLFACLEVILRNALTLVVKFLEKQSIRQRRLATTGTMASPSSSSSSSLSPPPVNAPYLPRRTVGAGGLFGVHAGFHSPLGPVASSSGQECQMSWISELMPMYLSSIEKRYYLSAIIDALREWLNDIKEKIVTPGVGLNVRMMLACFYAHLDQFNEALDWVNAALDNLKTLKRDDRPELHTSAYAYLLRANFYKINRRMKLMEGQSMKLVEQDTAQDLKEIEGMYSGNERPFQAAISFAKAMLAKVMAYQDKQIELLKDATELEPNCAQWHRLLYTALRKKRRESGRRRYLSLAEIAAISRAYNLDPDCCLNQSFYAGMLEEKMKSKQDMILSEIKEEMGDEIISLMRSALEKNPEDEWTHVRLAEIYAYGYFPHLDPKEGELMFEELEERWPRNSMVLHKFGKYFVMAENKPTKALEYYARALECDSGNYPCLMDYLKTCQGLGKGLDHMLEMVEKCLGLSCLQNTGPFIKMNLAKGILLWMLDNNEGGSGKQEACQAWIAATKKDLGSSVYIAKTIVSGYWNVIGKYSIDLDQLQSILNVYLSRATSQRDHDQIRAIERLISELGNQESLLNEPIFVGQYHNRNFSTSSSRSSLSNHSFVTAKTSLSQADAVNNWRDAAPQIPPLIGGSGTGIFAKYEDPMELRFRGGFQPGFKLGLTTVPPQQPYKYAGHGRGGGDGKKASLADMDNDWRR